MLVTPVKIRTLRRKLYAKAKQEPGYRFYALYDKVYRRDVLHHAYRLVRSNKGAPGIDGVSFEAIEATEGVETFLEGLAEEVKNGTYRPRPVRRVMIPKPDGSQRPLGIPTIRDRVVQMGVKLMIEPIFEADFCDGSYGFRPKRSAHDAMGDLSYALHKGHTEVIDADLSKYFDTIPHAKLLAVVAERMADGVDIASHQAMAESIGRGEGRGWQGSNHWRKGQSTRNAAGRCNLSIAGEPVPAPFGQDMGAPWFGAEVCRPIGEIRR